MSTHNDIHSTDRITSPGTSEAQPKRFAAELVDPISARTKENAAADPITDSLECNLEVGARILAKDLFRRTPMATLRVPPNTSIEMKLEILVEKCGKTERIYSEQHKEWINCHRSFIAAGVLVEEDRTKAKVIDDVRSGPRRNDPDLEHKIDLARATVRKDRTAEARRELSESLLKKLGIPSFAMLGKPWLTHDRIEAASHVDELFLDAPVAFFDKALRMAQAFGGAFRTGVEEGIYGQVTTGTDLTSLKYSFITTERIDVITQERISMRSRGGATGDVVSEISATQRTERIEHQHDLVSPRFFRVKDALLNPQLDVPDHYLEAMEQAIQFPAELAYVVFGTQLIDRRVARTIDLGIVEHESILAENVEIEVEPEEELVEQVRVRWEPALVWFDSVVPLAWGAVAMKRQKQLYQDHQRLFDEHEQARDKLRLMEISGLTLIGAGSAMLLLTLFEALLLSSHSLLSALLIFFLPAALAVGMIYAGFDRRWKKTKQLRQDAEQTLADGLEELSTKHPSFDPHKPRFPRGNG